MDERWNCAGGRQLCPMPCSSPGQAGLSIPMPQTPQRDNLQRGAVKQPVQWCRGARAGFLSVAVELPAQTSAIRTSVPAPSLDPADGTRKTLQRLGESSPLCWSQCCKNLTVCSGMRDFTWPHIFPKKLGFWFSNRLRELGVQMPLNLMGARGLFSPRL